MDALGTGLILIVNGFLSMLGHLADPITIFGIILAGSLWWLATIEIESLNRASIKPTVRRH